jgi:hypothetical protein
MATNSDFVVKHGLVVKANTTVPAKGNLQTSSIVRTTARPSLDFVFTRNDVIDPRLTVIRPNQGTVITKSGKMQSVPANTARIDYDIQTGQCLGLLVEDTRTNLLSNSTQFSNLYSATPNTFVVANDIESLHPSAQVYKSTRDTSTGDNNIGYAEAPALSTSTVSVASAWVWLPSATTITTAYLTFEGQTFSVYNALDLNKRNQWQRISSTCTSNTTTGVTNCIRATGMVTGGYLYSTCWQVESGAWPTSYIPTKGAQASRIGDYVYTRDPSIALSINLNAGTIYVEFDSINNGRSASMGNDFPIVYDFDEQNTQNDGYWLLLSNGYGPGLAVNNPITGTSNATITIATPLGDQSLKKLATAFQVGDLAATLNGAPVQTSSNITVMPTGIDRISIGTQSYVGGYGNYHSGHIRRLTYWPQRLPNTQLLQLTS